MVPSPCIASIPHLNDLAEQLKDKEVVFISLTEEARDVVEPFLKRRPIKGWVALGSDHQASDAYHVSGIPYTVIVGRDGRIKGKTHPTALTAEHIEKACRGESLGLSLGDEAAAAEGTTVPVKPGKPSYGSSFVPGRLPAVGLEKDVLPDPLAQVIVRSGPEPRRWFLGRLGAKPADLAQ